jgi:hypothetical protein
MGFMDQVKAAANDLVDSVEGSLTSGNAARDVEKHYRDLGMITYLHETGRAIDQADRARILGALQAAEAAGAMSAFTLQTGQPPAAAPAPPPAPPTGAAPPPPYPAEPGPPPAPPSGDAPPPPPPTGN